MVDESKLLTSDQWLSQFVVKQVSMAPMSCQCVRWEPTEMRGYWGSVGYRDHWPPDRTIGAQPSAECWHWRRSRLLPPVLSRVQNCRTSDSLFCWWRLVSLYCGKWCVAWLRGHCTQLLMSSPIGYPFWSLEQRSRLLAYGSLPVKQTVGINESN